MMPVASDRCPNIPPSFGFILCDTCSTGTQAMHGGSYAGVHLELLRHAHIKSKAENVPLAFQTDVGAFKHYGQQEFCEFLFTRSIVDSERTINHVRVLHLQQEDAVCRDFLHISVSDANAAAEAFQIDVDGVTSVFGQPHHPATPNLDLPALMDADDWASPDQDSEAADLKRLEVCMGIDMDNALIDLRRVLDDAADNPADAPTDEGLDFEDMSLLEDQEADPAATTLAMLNAVSGWLPQSIIEFVASRTADLANIVSWAAHIFDANLIIEGTLYFMVRPAELPSSRPWIANGARSVFSFVPYPSWFSSLQAMDSEWQSSERSF